MDNASRPADTAALRERVQLWGALRLLLALPMICVSVAVVGGVAMVFGRVVAVVATLLWIASGLVAFLPAVPVWIAKTLFATRDPEPLESRVIDPAWAAVLAKAGVPASTGPIRVQRDRGVVAPGDRFVMTVPQSLVHGVSARHLEALLARELGYHLGGSASSALLVAWYSLPGRLAVRVGTLAIRLLLTATRASIQVALFARSGASKASVRAFDRVSIWIAVLFFVLPTIVVFAVYVVPAVAIGMALAIGIAYGDSKIRARRSALIDRFAIELGYGDELAQLSAMSTS
ncbi:hypothetical protein [Nocardia goodfellowii]|uniref:STE24 endopeptidase n=1 Tax=Nocardia goodfellowii TaxID=882446 RepID=A0ABS4QJR7_9NOCA|nr:hypothetical protein [Nocardia goodfellowii]MBP2191360.1 STE24 endopeptidase [Nocardia goodfellowii]